MTSETGKDKNKKSNNNNNKKISGKKKHQKGTLICHGCKEPAHIRRNCPKRKEKSKSEKDQKQQTTPPKREEEAMIAESNFSMSTENWILDSGGTEHMTYDLDSMEEYQELSIPKRVRFGDNNYVHGLGTGTVNVRAFLGQEKYKDVALKSVLYVPELGRKLISLSAATTHGNYGE